MITSGIIYALYGMLDILIRFFPEAEALPSAFFTAANTASQHLYMWNLLFPLDTLFTLIGMTTTLLIAYSIIKIGMFSYGLLRGMHVKI